MLTRSAPQMPQRRGGRFGLIPMDKCCTVFDMDKQEEKQTIDTDYISDGYHAFGELYDHRTTLYLALCRHRTDAWKSRVHSDGSSWPGWFVVGIGREPGKQITYHLPDARWDEATMPEDLPPPFDGHTPAMVLARLKDL